MRIFNTILYFCCCGCCRKKRKGKKGKQKPSAQNVKISDKTKLVSEGVKIGTFEQNLDQIKDKQMITKEKLKNELKSAFKGGKSSYSTQWAPKHRHKKKETIEEHNLKIVKQFLDHKNCKFDRYLDSGNYSDVYKIHYNPQDQDMALKVIKLDKVDEYYRENLLPNELKVLQKIPNHENIIQILELSVRKDRIFIFMEFATNGTVTEWLRDKGALTEKLAKFMFRGILDAVHALQTLQIAHRDLKLENILLTAQLNPKLTDFSYSIEVDPAHPLSDQFCGTLPYFAPECLQKLPHNPFISDAWGLGVCFYIMINDRLPFALGDDSLMLQQQLKKEWFFRKKIVNNLSDGLKNIIKSLLEPDVKIRATTFELKNNPWFKENLKSKI